MVPTAVAKNPQTGIRAIAIKIFASIDTKAILNGVLVLLFAKNTGENIFCKTNEGSPMAKINKACAVK